MHRPELKPKNRNPTSADTRRARQRQVTTGTVLYPVAVGLHHRLNEEALAEGKTAAALMTELLEAAVSRRQRVRYPVLRPAEPTPSSSARARLHERFVSRLVVNPALTRQLVSFQASKTTPFYRWFKYKEAFSPELVDCLLSSRRVSDELMLPGA